MPYSSIIPVLERDGTEAPNLENQIRNWQRSILESLMGNDNKENSRILVKLKEMAFTPFNTKQTRKVISNEDGCIGMQVKEWSPGIGNSVTSS